MDTRVARGMAQKVLTQAWWEMVLTPHRILWVGTAPS